MRVVLLLAIVVLLIFVGDAKKTKYRTERINFIYDKALQHVKDRQNLARLEVWII